MGNDAVSDDLRLVRLDALIGETPRKCWEIARSGKIPGVRKLGRAWYISPADWAAWLAGPAANDVEAIRKAVTRDFRRGVGR